MSVSNSASSAPAGAAVFDAPAAICLVAARRRVPFGAAGMQRLHAFVAASDAERSTEANFPSQIAAPLHTGNRSAAIGQNSY